MKTNGKVHAWTKNHAYLGRGQIVGCGVSCKAGILLIQMEDQERLMWINEINYISEIEILELAEKIK